MKALSKIKGLVLFLIASTLAIVLAPLGVLWFIIKNRQWSKIDNYFLSIAWSIDQFGNVIFQQLFRDIFVRKQVVQSGNIDMTISEWLKGNKDNLTWAGKTLAWLLNKIDPNHI